MQKHRVNKLAMSDFSKQALKMVTLWYARKSKKPDGLSSYEIAEKVRKEFDGVGPHAATIRKYVKANLQGMSPLKCGVKGDVPAWAFKSLCLAFESYVRIQQLNSRLNEITYKKLAVAKWREIHTSNTPPSVLAEWTEEDEAELKRIAEMEIDMADTYLGRYAAMQKKNAVAAVLDFTNEEWESLKQLKEDNTMRGMTNPSEEGNDNNNGGGLGAENWANGGEINEEAV
jgi:hypothetical protein